MACGGSSPSLRIEVKSEDAPEVLQWRNPRLQIGRWQVRSLHGVLIDNFDDEAEWRGAELQPPWKLVRFQPSSLWS